VPESTSYKLRLISLVAGQCNITPRADGLLVDENATVSFSVNGVQHNLMESVLMIGGAHKLPGRSSVNSAEFSLYFKHITDFSRHICLTIPVEIGTSDTGKSKQYFSLLGNGVNANRPKLGEIIPTNTPIFIYRGADLRGRTATASQASSVCSPVKRVITYYVCMNPITILANDFQRLKRASGSAVGPAKPLFPAISSRLVQLGTRVTGITVETVSPAIRTREQAGVPTNAMKCYRLNADKDIVNNKVFIGGNHTSLTSELATDSVPESSDSSIKPGDIQKWMGIVLGIVAGLIICALIVYFVWSGTFKNYIKAQQLYKSPSDLAL